MNNKKLTIACSTEYKDYSFNKKYDIWTLISLKAPLPEEKDIEEERASIDIVAVIDKSGSMAGEKLDLVKKTLEFLVSQLNEKDRLCLVTYDTFVYLDFKLTPMTKYNKEKILQIIKKISCGSLTNLCSGLIKGLCQVIERPSKEKNEVASVLLFTDGLANEGKTQTNDIIAAIKDPKTHDGSCSESSISQLQQPHQRWLKNIYSNEKLQTTESNIVKIGPADASIYTFGFGSDHDAQMLKEISDAGNGMYYFIENTNKIAEAFGHCLGGLLSTVAQGIQLEILMEDRVFVKEVHSTQPMDKQERRVKISMGDLQSEESRDVVLQLSIDSLDSPTECQTLFNVKLNYLNVINDCLESSNAVLTVLRPEKSEEHNEANSNVEVNNQIVRVNVTKAMNIAYEKAEKGDFSGAFDVLHDEKLNLLLANSETLCCMKADLVCCESATKKVGWLEKGRNAFLNITQQHERQRSSYLQSKSYITEKRCIKQGAAINFVSK